VQQDVVLDGSVQQHGAIKHHRSLRGLLRGKLDEGKARRVRLIAGQATESDGTADGEELHQLLGRYLDRRRKL
jgi:hypothetical protein